MSVGCSIILMSSKLRGQLEEQLIYVSKVTRWSVRVKFKPKPASLSSSSHQPTTNKHQLAIDFITVPSCPRPFHYQLSSERFVFFCT
jgi:hypothetical protein